MKLALNLEWWASGPKLKTMLTLILILNGWFGEAQPPKLINDPPTNPGEKLTFRLSYGWFTIGNATWQTDSKVHTFGGEQCYKVKVNASSAGLAGLFSKVNDEWGTYVRTSDLLPMMDYRDLQEGKYLLDEKVYYDYGKKQIKLEKIRKGEKKPTEYYDMDISRHGMLGGFMLTRCVDFAKMKPGEKVTIPAFFEGEQYQMEVIYKGIEEVKTKVGKLKAYKVTPVMPPNKIFPGTYPITAWFSADGNRLPLKVTADMFFGSAYVELVDYKNIKFGPDYKP
jgi:hypothetical protein